MNTVNEVNRQLLSNFVEAVDGLSDSQFDIIWKELNEDYPEGPSAIDLVKRLAKEVEENSEEVKKLLEKIFLLQQQQRKEVDDSEIHKEFRVKQEEYRKFYLTVKEKYEKLIQEVEKEIRTIKRKS